MLASRALAPTIIGHDRVLHRTVIVKPGQKIRGIPVRIGRLPVAIAPEHVGLITLDELIKLRTRLLRHKGLRGPLIRLVLQVERMKPLLETVIQAKTKIRSTRTNGSLQLREQVPPRPDVRIPVGRMRRGIQSVAVVMLCGRHNISSPSRLKELHPSGRIKEAGREERRERLVRPPGRVLRLHEAEHVGILLHFPVIPEPFTGKGRDRVDAPMDEDAKLGVVVPRGERPRIQGVPRGLVSNARGREVVGVSAAACGSESEKPQRR